MLYLNSAYRVSKDTGISHLTLTSVVFEFKKYKLPSDTNTNLTLTSVVFESLFKSASRNITIYLTLTSVVFE